MENWQLKIDRDQKTIQGVHFEDNFEFQVVEFAVKNNVMEGWQPTRQDVLELKQRLGKANPTYEAQFNEIFGG